MASYKANGSKVTPDGCDKGAGYAKGVGSYTRSSLRPAEGGSNLSHPTKPAERPIESTRGR